MWITIAVLVGLALLFQGWVMYVSSVEEQPYEVLETYNEVEIRHYPPARMASVQNPETDKSKVSNSSFRVLAGYIFGGNSENQEFAMTAPVHMHESDSGTRMSFVLPQEAWNEELPDPNNNRVQLHWSKEEYVAAIRFGGFRSEEAETKYKNKLIQQLNELGIKHNNDFRVLGYDPPFKLTDRRNEVIVSIDRGSLPVK